MNNQRSWLRADPGNYKQFVMFRVGEVLESIKISEWRYIPTKDNVADDTTKWKTNFEFNMESRWFRGPNFLLEIDNEWPENISNVAKPSIESRKHILMAHFKL